MQLLFGERSASESDYKQRLRRPTCAASNRVEILSDRLRGRARKRFWQRDPCGPTGPGLVLTNVQNAGSWRRSGNLVLVLSFAGCDP